MFCCFGMRATFPPHTVPITLGVRILGGAQFSHGINTKPHSSRSVCHRHWLCILYHPATSSLLLRHVLFWSMCSGPNQWRGGGKSGRGVWMFAVASGGNTFRRPRPPLPLRPSSSSVSWARGRHNGWQCLQRLKGQRHIVRMPRD